MLILELSSYLLEIPNDTCTTLSRYSLAAQHSVKSILQARKQLRTLTCPIDLSHQARHALCSMLRVAS